MSTLEEQQNARFAALDPLLPPIAPPTKPSEPLRVSVDGMKAGGLLTRTTHEPGDWLGLWEPAEVWDLTAVPGESGAAGLAALLEAWRERMRGQPIGPDSSCTLTWPSRDAEAAAVLLAHGFAPQTCLAVRAAEAPAPVKPGVEVRRAAVGDLETLVDLRLEELRYAALVGPAAVRPGAREMLAVEVKYALRFSGMLWLADTGGVPAGMVSCAFASPMARTPLAGRLPAGDWGYVGTLSVSPAARDGGVGRALMAVAHDELVSAGVRGTFLYYHLANPLSPVFWHRQGYRPLWTTWAHRPAWS